MRVSAIKYGVDGDTAIIRSIISADSIGELAAPSVCGEGEYLIIMAGDELPLAMTDAGLSVPDLDTAYQIIADQKGLGRGVSTCAVIDQGGDVTAVIQANPNLDEVAGATLYQHEDAAVGAVLDANGDFVAAAAFPTDAP